MNILYMHSHDTGRYIEPYGYNISTPNLMKLSKEGTLFRNAFSAGATCCPSRSALLTGMVPHSNGMFGHTSRGFKLNDYGRHIVQFLNRNGFETALCGIQHEAQDREIIGYHKLLDDPGYPGDNVQIDLYRAELAARYIKQKKGKPFFLSFGMKNTHRKFPRPDEEVNLDNVMPPFTLYNARETREDMAGFITSARAMDRCAGIVLDALKESGHEEDTLVIYTTDHGIAFPRMKSTLYDTGIGVSLIIRFPGNKRRGQALDALVSHLDIYPTICDLINIDKPEWLQGTSMTPLFEAETDGIRSEIFAEMSFHACYEPARCIRTERYKYIKFFDDYDRIVPAHIDDSPGKDFLINNGYLENPKDREMLFDLYLDPVESKNRVNDGRYSHIHSELSKRLEKWMEATCDPLLDGKVPRPEGALVNKLGVISPHSKEYEK